MVNRIVPRAPHGPGSEPGGTVPRPSRRRRGRLGLLATALVSAAAGYALAIVVAKAGAPKRTVYELPHDFTVASPTFSPPRYPARR